MEHYPDRPSIIPHISPRTSFTPHTHQYLHYIMSVIKKVLTNFPHPVLSAIEGEPTYETLAALHIELNDNADSIHSNGGGGVHGLLALTVSDTVYETHTGHVFLKPSNLGASVTIPPNSTGPVNAALTRAYNKEARVWQEYTSRDNALKQKLLAAVNGIYVRAKHNILTGFATVTTRHLLDHLYTMYGRVTAQVLEKRIGY